MMPSFAMTLDSPVSIPQLCWPKVPLHMQPDVFASRVNISDMKLTPHGVCVLWEWEWIEDMELFEPSIESQEDSDLDSQDSTDSEVSPSCVASSIPVTHTITFKCIGTVRSPAYQNSLKKVCEATYRRT